MKNSKKQNRLVNFIPNMVTTLNLMMGIFSILLLIGNNSMEMVRISCFMILAGALADGVDGMVARQLGAESELGRQLDSFSDSITFGLAPVVVLYAILSIQNYHNIFLICAFAIYPLAGMLRLARYNLGNFKEFFVGLPITAAGVIVVLYALYLSYGTVPFYHSIPIITAALLFLLSVSMVSSIKVPRFNIFLKEASKKLKRFIVR